MSVKTALRYTLLAAFVCGALAFMFALKQINEAVYQPLTLPESPYTVLVSQGETLTSVVNKMAEQGIIRRPSWLLLFAKTKKQTSIRTGEYQLEQGMTGEMLLQCLASGKVVQYQVTFIEGTTLAENLALLTKEKKLINDVAEMSDSGFEDVFGFKRTEAEGRFFPDTYNYVSGMKASDILRQANARLQSILDEEWQKRDKDLPYKTPYEALVMASIVEKETGVANERKQIAGVFVRRLNKGMKLQTDPTVIYGLGANFNGDLKRSHLKEYSPWNTYVIDGLPPTPIALPGKAAIQAALNPASGKALFFVARGDGSHVFSETLAQHEQAVDNFQRRRNSDYRSAPQEESAKPDTSQPDTATPAVPEEKPATEASPATTSNPAPQA